MSLHSLKRMGEVAMHNPNINMNNGVYEQQRFYREMEKYNQRLLAKMQGLQKVPTVSYKMMEEALALNLSQIYNVPVNVWSFARLTELPQVEVWRHACPHLGVVGGNSIDFNLYTTPARFTFCTACGKVIYYMEKQETTYM